MYSRIRYITLVCIILMCLVAVPAGGMRLSAAEDNLVILFTHDLHSRLLPHRVALAGDGQAVRGGYARIAQVVQQERQRYGEDKVLLLDGGDFSMGSLFHTRYLSDPVELRIMGKMGYQAAAVGNHEFDFGSDRLALMLQKAKASGERLPILLASNIAFNPGDSPLAREFKDFPVSEYTILEKNGLRIGLFALIGKDAADNIAFSSDVSFPDQVEAARRMVDRLRNQEQVDMVIALSHTGTSENEKASEDEILAKQAPGIDVIVSGHTHTVLRQPILAGKTVIVSSGGEGSYLGILRLGYARDSGFSVNEYTLKEITPDLPEDTPVAQAIAGYQKQVDQSLEAEYGLKAGQVVGESDFAMTSLEEAQAKPGETGVGDLIADAFRYGVQQAEGEKYDYVALALEPIGVIRGTLLQGEIEVADTFDLLPLGFGPENVAGYPLVTVYLTGAEVKQALEVEASLAALYPSYHMQVSGVRFTTNPHRVFLDRVTSVEISDPDGVYQPVEPARLYRVCVNYYTASTLGVIPKKTYGLVNITPKDRNGQLITDMKTAIVDADPAEPGTQELKEWVALTEYIQSFPDSDGDGIPNLPEQYKTAQGRNVPQPSWNPIELLKGGNRITIVFSGVVILIIGLAAFSAYAIRRRIRRGASR